MRLVAASIALSLLGVSPGLAATLPSLPGPVIPTPTPSSAFTLRHTLNNPLPSASTGFGTRLATDGALAIVGAPRAFDNTLQQGSAALFSVETGALLQEFSNPTTSGASNFGSGVAVGEGLIAIGAAFESGNGIPSFAGRAYVYDAQTFALVDTLQAPIPESSGRFGASVAIGDGRVYVGSTGQNVDGQTDPGRVFAYDPPVSIPLRVFDNPAPRQFGGVGRDIAYDDGRLLSNEIGAIDGALGFDDVNNALLFDAGTGGLIRSIADPFPEVNGNSPANHRFGIALDIDGDVIVIGDDSDDTSGVRDGRVSIFSALTGNLTRTLLSPDPGQGELFGAAVATDGQIVAVGEPGHDGFGGQVLIYSALTGALLQTIGNPEPSGQGVSAFGLELALAGDALLVGGRGRAFVYSRADLVEPPAPVPLPAPLAMLGAALLGLFGVARKGSR